LSGNERAASQARMSTREPILLCDSGFYGTLAAARSLGRQGVPIVVADSAHLGPATWSRFVRRKLVCPVLHETERFAEWLLAFGKREPRHVVYPTSDEVAYVLSRYRDDLASTFALYQPDLKVLLGVLDKRELLTHAKAAGLDVPDTWFPEDSRGVQRAAREADGPLMVKPRTQLFLRTHNKGAVTARGPTALETEYDRFTRDNRYTDVIASALPGVQRPMLQRYYPVAEQAIYSIAGFRDRTGAHVALLGANKVLQTPRKIGVGLCFEPAKVHQEIAAGVRLMLERVGYYGVFEVEFIKADNRFLLIDFNPRFYNQIALDVARGLPLPTMAYAAALGETTEVERLVAKVSSERSDRAFCNRIGMAVFVGAQRLFGSMSADEARRWRKWRRDHHDILVDPILDADDPRPIVAEVAAQIYRPLRHPRAFFRSIAQDRR
jgi:D-aspartate ligase